MPEGKLVRDKIPDIIRATGREPVTRVADDEEYATRLRAKLVEEVEEFLASDDDPAELADVMEVVFALAERTGVTRRELQALCERKADERGGFAARIVWLGNMSD